MEISVDKFCGIYRQNTVTQTRKNGDQLSEIKRERCFDAIRISPEAEAAMEESEFAKTITAKLSGEIRQEASGAGLDQLRERIQNGGYSIDVPAIAARILLTDRGDL